ncbi:MAG: N-acetylmuramoyl-L-alanine amidase [Acidobacteria bacterium]|nr:N-acetylmuramoyl-L-alanine amidase [Acidobacteriota bacterium]
MIPGLRLPSAILLPVLEWRARRIADPVERLRFLRRATSAGARPGRRKSARGRSLALILFVVLLLAPVLPNSDANVPTIGRAAGIPPAASAPDRLPDVWLVEKTGTQELYSNGLRIETGFTVAGLPRAYRVFDRQRREETGEERSTPAGIVFHTTESHLAPFQAEQNRQLKQIGEALVEYVRRNRCYHYVIDRFGRVWRVVRETDVADHAGYSVWADSQWLYVNLNHSFLGVSFEAQTRAGQADSEATPAQLLAARLLTGMLRGKYRIPAADCVTHAQVSVNPRNLRIGYHTDWAGNFPYAGLGLADNYDRPVAALWAFGFTYDPAYLHSTGSRLWQGLSRAEEQLRQEATAHGVGVALYRKTLHGRYQAILKTLGQPGASEEKDDHEAQ